MARPGFFYARGPSTIEQLGAKASETIAVGDLVAIDDTTGYVDIATATDTLLAGVAVSAVSSASAGDEILVETNPEAIFRATCSGTSTQGLVGDYLDIEGTTGAMYINEDASTYGVILLLDPVSAVGASAEHFCKIARHKFGSRTPTSITVSEMAANSVDSDQYVDGSIDTVHLSADCVTSAKIADDQIDSEHIAAGAVDNEHMAANSIDSDQYVDGSIDNVHLAANSVDSDNYVDGSIDTAHIAADQITSALIADDQIDSEHYVAGSIDNEHLAANSVDSANYIDKSIDPEHTADVTYASGDGFPLIATATYSDATTTNITVTRKCRVVDFWLIGSNSTAGTCKLTDTDDNDITDAVTVDGTDKKRFAVTTIDDAHSTLAASETLKVVSTGANSAAQAYVLLLPVA